MSSFAMYIHLPGVALQCDEFHLGLGTVRRLPFEQWQELDGGFRYTDRKYERAKPAFLVAETAIDNLQNQDELLNHVAQLYTHVHRAFLLGSRVPRLPTPKMSAIYVVSPPTSGKRQILRMLGPLEREWILFGSDLIYDYDESQLGEVRATSELLGKADLTRIFRGVVAGIDTLERTARPDSWWGGNELRHALSDFVHCVAACEGILLPPADKRQHGTITSMFGRHAAALVSRRHEELESQAGALSELYRLRSRLIHGRIGMADLTEQQMRNLPAARLLLRAVVVAALKLALTSAGQDLVAVLACATAGLDDFNTLQQRLTL